MDSVSSVSTTTYAPPPQTKQAEQAERPEPKQARSQEAQQPKPEEQKPAPVVNTQGQTTGRIISTSA